MQQSASIYHQLNSKREKMAQQARSKERQQYYAVRRLANVLEGDVSFLIPQHIAQNKVEFLKQIYELISSGFHPKIVIEFDRQYFVQEFEKADSVEMKAIIMRLNKLLNQWNEQDYYRALQICEDIEILYDIVEYLDVEKKTKILRTKSNQTQKSLSEDQRYDILNKVLKLMKDNEVSSKHQSVYCYIALHLLSPTFNSELFEQVISKLDELLGDKQVPYQAMFALQYFLSFSSGFHLYPLISKMNNFHVIIENCASTDISTLSLAFEIVIDIIYDNQQIASNLMKNYEMVKILERTIKNPILVLKAMWAISNLIVFDQNIKDLMPIILSILNKNHQQKTKGSDKIFNQSLSVNSALNEIQNIVINLLFSVRQQSILSVLPHFSLLVPHIKNILSSPIRKNKEDIPKNMIYALKNCLPLNPQVKQLYLRYGIDRQLQIFMNENPSHWTKIVEEILDYLHNQVDQDK